MLELKAYTGKANKIYKKLYLQWELNLGPLPFRLEWNKWNKFIFALPCQHRIQRLGRGGGQET